MLAAARTMARRLRIQYASDLHLEFAENGPFQPILKPGAPYLALAGDIGWPHKSTYRDFLHYCSRNWQDVFVVAGNHELYNKRLFKQWKHMPPTSIATAEERLALCAATCAEFPNVHFLNRRRIDRGGVAFLGCTLWTDLTNKDAADAALAMNDFRLIATSERQPLTPAIKSEWHFRDRAWLAREIGFCEEEGRPAVVITHHLPSFDLIAERHRGSPLNAAFASDCSALIRPPVRAWLCGHTHTGVHRTWPHRDGSVTLGAVNPRGYPGEQGTGYSREIFVDISTEPGPQQGGDMRDPLLVDAAEGYLSIEPKKRISLPADIEEDIEFI